jgi:hypothetical protein
VKLQTPDHLETVVFTKFVGQEFELHMLLYVTVCKNPGLCWSEHFMVWSRLVWGSVFHCNHETVFVSPEHNLEERA